jgi:hypothetical protein
VSTIPHPDRITNSLELVADKVIPDIIANYHDAYQYGFDRRDRGQPTDEEREASTEVSRVKRTSDPTGDIVIEQERTRRILRRAGKKIDGLTKAADSIQGLLSEIFTSEDDDYEPLASATIPDTATRSQVAEARRAKRKREIVDEIERHRRAIVLLERELRGEGAA